MTQSVEPQQPQQPQQMSVQDFIANQKNAIVTKGNEIVGLAMNVIDSWAANFTVNEKIKNKRTEQVNRLLAFVNQLANEGILQLTELGNDVKDPTISNKVLDANNTLMTAARNVLSSIQQEEEAFQKEVQESMTPPKQDGPKTEVKAKEV